MYVCIFSFHSFSLCSTLVVFAFMIKFRIFEYNRCDISAVIENVKLI